MSTKLLSSDKINHQSNHPFYLQTSNHDTINDKRVIIDNLQRYLSDECESKGLNYATSHYMNENINSMQNIIDNNVLSHTFKEGQSNFLLQYFEDDQIRNMLTEEIVQEWLIEELDLNKHAKDRVAARQRENKIKEDDEREELKRHLYNMFFRMKELVQKLNDSDHSNQPPMTDEKRIDIIESLRKYLIPRTRKGISKDDPSTSKLKVKTVREYLMIRSDELKEIIYEDVFFEENMNKNKNDEIMKKLTQKLEPENYEKLKSKGGEKTNQFMRLIMTRALMMKEERDRVILKRLQEKKLEEKEEEELRRIMNNYQKKEDKKYKKVVYSSKRFQ